jgi:hypothetical protein
MRDFDLTYLSLGAGVQSTALLICSALGLHDTPRADLAIFADTGDEPSAVYRHLWNLAAWSPIPVISVAFGHLSADLLSRRTKRARIPAFVKNPDGSGGIMNRQCTTAYKIEPIERYIRQYLGLKSGARAAGRVCVRSLLGISLDECDRMKPNRTPWIENAYPLVDARLKRSDCEQIAFRQFGYIPTKSACIFCPYRSPGDWRRLRREAPADFERAAEFDSAFRALEIKKHGDRGRVYVHRSMMPLSEADFGDSQGDLFAEECAGVCGV